MSTVFPLLIGVLIAALAAIIWLSMRAWRRKGVDPVIGLTLTLAAIFAGFSLLATVLNLIATLTNTQVLMAFPVHTFWPTLPEGSTVTGTSAMLADGGFHQAEGLIDGLSSGARVMWAISQALGFLVPGAIAGLIALACFQLIRGAAFAPVVARAAMITAVVVLVGGLASGILADIAGSMASQEVLGGAAMTIPNGDDADVANWPKPTIGIEIPFWPIGASLGLAALATIFRYGSRLQRDTEGLV